jgi:LysM domain
MRTLFAVLLVASSAWAQTEQTPTKAIPQQGPPPKTLTVRPDGHVSANQDPANPEKFDVRVVVKGDTLSGISEDVLKNPRLWPQLWEQNEHIINPHWIYPNDKILIKPVVPITEAKPPEPEPEPEPVPAPVAQNPPARPIQRPPAAPPQPPSSQQQVLIVEPERPVPEAKFEDLYCSGSVRFTELPTDLKVISKFDSSGGVLSTDTEYVYLSQGSQDGIAVGSLYQVVRATKSVRNPYRLDGAERYLGMHYLDVGQVRVVLAQPEFSLARVINTCADGVDVGDTLVAFQPVVVPPPSRPRPFSPVVTTSSAVSGNIVTTKDVMLNFGSSMKASQQIPGVRSGELGLLDRGIAGEGSIVYVAICPSCPMVKPGDLFIVYRDVDIHRTLYHYPKEVKKLKNARVAVGELLVVKVAERAATALVTYSTDGLILGDTIEPR